MNTRRDFFKQLAGIGLFSILPGAGRIWVAEKKLPEFVTPDGVDFLPAWNEYLRLWEQDQRALWPLFVASKVWYPKDPAYYELFSTTPPINGATA